MGSHRRSFFTEPNPKEYLGTCNNDSSSLEFPASCSSAGKSQFSDVVSKVNFQPVAAGQSEVNFLGRYFHPNIISLLGYCLEDEMLVLVYEFVQRGSLENQLFPRVPIFGYKAQNCHCSWSMFGFFTYFIEENHYRDFKASSLLLDKNYKAKLSDFGLAMLGPSSEESPILTAVAGTCGYAAPEYIATGNTYLKSDGFSYSVVLLELLTGLRAIDTNCSGEQKNLVNWLKPMLSQRKKLKTIIDVHMKGHFSAEAAFLVAELSLKCIESDPQSWLSMKEVVEVLKEIEALKDKAK